MKFEQLLKENTVREWKEKYINYHKLNMMITTIIEDDKYVPGVKVGFTQWKLSSVKEQFYSPDRWKQELMRLSNAQMQDDRQQPDLISDWVSKRTWWESENEKEFFDQIAEEYAKVEKFFFDKSKLYGEKLQELTSFTREDVKALKGREKLTIEYNFKELWRGLQLLSNYRIWNFMGFAKILKKHDKNSPHKVQDELMSLVQSSNFSKGTFCDDCIGLLETKFTDIFGEGYQKRREVLIKLKESEKGKCSRSEFLWTGIFLGFGIGCLLFLLIGSTARSLYNDSPNVKFLQSKIPMIRLLLFLCLIGHLTALDLCVWEIFSIHWQFIFRASHAETVHSSQLLMFFSIVFGILMASVSSMVIWVCLNLHHDEASIVIDFALPILFVTLLVAPCEILLLPLRSMMRVTFGRVFRATIWPPPVKFPDFFIADQFTSWGCLGKDITCIIYNWIPISWGIDCKKVYKLYIGWVLRPLPFWWRFTQCLRRWRTTRDLDHLLNMGKYALSLAVQFSIQVNEYYDKCCTSFVVIIFSISFCYSLTWDFYKDWGLFRTSNLLRQNISYPKWYYYCAMLFNIFARFGTLIDMALLVNDDMWELKAFFLGGLEILRRGIWNIFRVENEGVNNTGKFRAVDLIPLPQYVKDLHSHSEPEHIEMVKMVPLTEMEIGSSMIMDN